MSRDCIAPIVENQVENELEAAIMQWVIGVRGFRSCVLLHLSGHSPSKGVSVIYTENIYALFCLNHVRVCGFTQRKDVILLYIGTIRHSHLDDYSSVSFPKP